MRIVVRGIQLTIVLALLGLGSCSLHSGINPRGFSSSDDSLAVGFGVAVLAGALLLIRKWFWTSSDVKASAPRQPQANALGQCLDGEVVLSEPGMLSDFPVYLWAEQKEPFKTWHAADTQVPHNMADLFQVAAHAYLFFLWHIFISGEFGSNVATRVRMEQITRIDLLGNQMGQNLFSIVDEIQRAMTISTETPMPVPGHPDMQVPPVYGVALSILTTWRDSPYYVDPRYRGSHPPTCTATTLCWRNALHIVKTRVGLTFPISSEA